MKKTIITTAFDETQAFGISFAARLRGGEVLALHGDLGSGKTTFMQGLAKGLAIERNIISPTFLLMRTYSVKYKHIQTLYHLDMYRIETEAEAVDLGLHDLMGDHSNIVAIEWPDIVANILPKTTYHIFFEYIDNEKRRIKIGD
jgi:tRNA threonylcarbamoyladenosine biosynthesis protein TsaE